MGQEGSRPVRVWLVEDDDVLRDFLTSILHGAGLVATGISRAERILHHERSSLPDVIVLDLGMPQGAMQGMEALTRLRESDAGKEVPVVILSAYGDLVNRDLTTRLGVVAVLTKPLADAQELVDVIRQLSQA